MIPVALINFHVFSAVLMKLPKWASDASPTSLTSSLFFRLVLWVYPSKYAFLVIMFVCACMDVHSFLHLPLSRLLYFRFCNNFQFLNWFWICSPNSFPAVWVLAGSVKGLVVVGHSVVAKWWSPFAAIYMTWWRLFSKTHLKIVEANQHNMFRFYKSLTYWIHTEEEDAYWTSGSSIHIAYRHGPVYMHSASRLCNLFQGMGLLDAVARNAL